MTKYVLIISLFLIFSVNQGKSQNWAPDGAEWYYEYVHFWYMGYVHIQVVGDTIVNDTACKVLEKRSVIRNLEFDTTYYRYIGKEYMYSGEDKVYLFANDKFYAIYDFSSSPGDTIVIPQNDDLLEWCDTEGRIVVLDTGSTTINGQHLRTISVAAVEGTHWAIYGEIIETIGPEYSYMLPEPDWACVVDWYEGGRLRCYSDPDFGLYSTGISTECDYLVSIPEENESGYKIFPNPCAETFNITIPEGASKCAAEIYDLTGIKVKVVSLSSALNQIDISELTSGLYIIKIITGTSSMSRKIFKAK